MLNTIRTVLSSTDTGMSKQFVLNTDYTLKSGLGVKSGQADIILKKVYSLDSNWHLLITPIFYL